MRTIWFVTFAVLAVFWAAPLPIAAQQPAAGDAQAAWDSMYQQWRDLLTSLRDLQNKYKLAKPEERKAIENDFNNKVAQAQALLPKLTAAGEAAYVVDPAKQQPIGDFLGAMALQQLQRDSYEEAFRLAKLLIDHKHPNKELFRIGGRAAFEISDYDQAEKLLTLAKENNMIEVESQLKEIPKEREYWEKELAIRQAEDKPDDDPMALPRVLIKTNKGDIVVELFENEAPNTVANFISLVEAKKYDNTVFHRVLPGFMAQGGDPQGDGTGGPGYTIPCECYQDNFRRHFRGSLSMAHAGRDTGGSQFFLTFRPTRHLDRHKDPTTDKETGHTVFGRVIEGLEVLAELQRRDPQEPNPPKPDKIISATVLRKRNHEYKPIKVGEQPAGETQPGKKDDAKKEDVEKDDVKNGGAKNDDPGEAKKSPADQK
jgi:cyclophilin family peptidyl-prolyl cis-trans isomerase